MYINSLGHMTKMAAMPIYGINPSKIFFSRTDGSISKKLVKYRVVCIFSSYSPANETSEHHVLNLVKLI